MWKQLELILTNRTSKNDFSANGTINIKMKTQTP